MSKLAVAYLSKSGYNAELTPYPPTGAAATDIIQLPGLPLMGKVLVSLGSLFLERVRVRRLSGLHENFPLITLRLRVEPERGREDAPSSNTLAGLAALLPALLEKVQEERPNRRYGFELVAPASRELRKQRAILTAGDLTVSKLLKLAHASTMTENVDGTTFHFNRYFPYMLETRPPEKDAADSNGEGENPPPPR